MTEEMKKLLNELRGMELSFKESHNSDREPIDFSIEDENDNVCWVWGELPSKNIEVECDHPCIDWGDDDEMGECELCGAQCHWHWEYDYDDGYKSGDRVIHGWEKPDKIGGWVGRYLKAIERTNKGEEKMKIEVNNLTPEVENIKVNLDKKGE